MGGWVREHLAVALLVGGDLVWLEIVARAVAPGGARLAGGPAAGRLLLPLLVLPALALAGAYRAPRRWTLAEAVPAVVRASLLFGPAALAVLGVGALTGRPWPGPGRLGAAAAGLASGLIAIRLLAGRLRAAAVRRGRAPRRALVVGEPAAAARLEARLGRHAWLGQEVVGRLGPGPGDRSGDLGAVLARDRIDVVWLAPPDAADVTWLPAALRAADTPAVTWRILPEDFARVVAPGLGRLPPAEGARLRRRLRRDLALPLSAVAMVGSRGVPARYSGIERYVEEVGSRLVAAGLAVAVYCHRKYVTVRGTYRGMTLRFVPALRTRHLETWTHVALASLTALVREDEIWHYHALGPATWAWVPRLLGRRVVVTVQGLDWQRAKWGRLARGYLRLGEWASARLPHRTIVVSRVLARHYAQRYRIRPVYIPNGFTRAARRPPGRLRELGLDADGYLLFVGRLVPEKGCHTLLDAFARVATDKTLVLAGAGVYEDAYVQRLHETAARLGRVRFVGFVEGDLLDELYSNAYLVVHPSEMEGLSVALLEAVSHGNAVVVSDVPENLEAAADAAVVFRVRDADDLARQLQRLVDAPEAVAALRVRADQVAAALPDWDAVAERTRAVYEALLAGAAPGARA